MACLRRIGQGLCGRERGAGHENGIFGSRVVTGDMAIVAIDETFIHWFDLGRGATWPFSEVRASASTALASSAATCAPPTIPFSAESVPRSGAVERKSREGVEIEAQLTPLFDLLIHPRNLVTEHSDKPLETAYKSRPLLRWLVRLPGKDASEFEWLNRVERSHAIDTYGAALALTRDVAGVPQLDALLRFAVRHRASAHMRFWLEFVRALDRVATFSDPCSVADFAAAVVGRHALWIETAICQPDPPDLRHLARTMILGGRADLRIFDWLPTGAVLDATRDAVAHRAGVSSLLLGCTTLAAPMVRLICEMACSLPHLAAAALDAAVTHIKSCRASAYPPHLFTVDDEHPAVFTYPNGNVAHVRLTISRAGVETLSHRIAGGPSDAGVFVVIKLASRSAIAYQVSDWSERNALVVRNRLDSLFDDSADNRTRFIADRLRNIGAGNEDWPIKCRNAARLQKRFGTDDMAGALAHFKRDAEGPGMHDYSAPLQILLAIGVAPTHPRLRALPWGHVRDAFSHKPP